MPIGAWIVSLVFDIASRVTDDTAVFAEGSYWLIGLGIIGALVAAIFGLLDLLAIPRGTPAFKTALTHMSINLLVVVIFVVGFALRAADGYETVGNLPLILSVVAIALLGVSGWLGGKRAYHYGVRVADELTQSEGFR